MSIHLSEPIWIISISFNKARPRRSGSQDSGIMWHNTENGSFWITYILIKFNLYLFIMYYYSNWFVHYKQYPFHCCLLYLMIMLHKHELAQYFPWYSLIKYELAHLGLDEVITMDRWGHSNPWQARADELQHSHLGRGILHSHSVRAQLEVRLASHYVLISRVIQMGIQHLFWESERTSQSENIN